MTERDQDRATCPAGESVVTVWFDGACPLCRREIAVMRRLDRNGSVRFVDIADPENECPINRGQALARFHVSEGGRVLSGAAAFAAMWRALPALRWLGLAARWRPIERLLERAYRAFLVARPALQRMMGQRLPK